MKASFVKSNVDEYNDVLVHHVLYFNEEFCENGIFSCSFIFWEVFYSLVYVQYGDGGEELFILSICDLP